MGASFICELINIYDISYIMKGNEIVSLFERFKQLVQKDVLPVYNGIGEDLFSIPYDYDGYDFIFESGKTDPRLYEEINTIITNHKFDIKEIRNYKELKINSDNDLFNEFYDEWLEYLKENKYVIHFDKDLSIREFSKSINELLKRIGSDVGIDEDFAVNKYRDELNRYTINNMPIEEEVHYDVLEANVVASELRKIGYELISFFNGFDNYDMAVIPTSKIERLKQIEDSIK